VKPHLPDVTLVCVDTICHELAALAVADCLNVARLGGVVIHSDNSQPFERALVTIGFTDNDPRITFVKTEPLAGLDAVMRYLWYEVPRHIETSHVLIVQWDSGIIDPSLWSDAFLQYDYIGAPWGWHGDAHEVGNGGFSLRSTRLMRFVDERRELFPFGNPEDDVLCRRYRPTLEKNGFCFAPQDVALRFSFERTGYMGRHFGYHGVFNWPRVFSVAAMRERIMLMLGNSYLNRPQHLQELLWAMKGQLEKPDAINPSFHLNR
jgi:Protein of unknown function (DUF5672)